MSCRRISSSALRTDSCASAGAAAQSATSSETAAILTSHSLRDFLEHHLGGAAADGVHARVARHALDGRLAHVAHAAMELQAVVHHLVDELAAVGLHHRHFLHAVLALRIER